MRVRRTGGLPTKPSAADRLRRGLQGLLALLIAWSALVAPVGVASARQGVVDDVAICDGLTEEAVRDELNTIAQGTFAGEDAAIDLDAMVARQWRSLGMDAVVRGSVAAAVDAIRRDEPYLETILSGWSPAKAEEMAQKVAVDAFSSEVFRAALDDLADAVALEIEAKLGLLSAESASLNLLCLQRFIAHSYSTAVVTAFQENIRIGTDALAFDAQGELDSGLLAVLEQHKPAIGGLGVIIAAQVSRRVVQRMGQALSRRVAGRITGRLLGRVGTTVIPLAGWIIGGGLIVYDVIESLDGALPQIETALTSPEVSATIQAEIVATIAPDLRRELPQIARQVADDLYNRWLEFKRQHRQVLAYAETDATFAALLAGSDLSTVADLLDAGMETLGVDGVARAVEDGTFARLAVLPAAAPMLRETGSPVLVLAWADAAGARFAAVSSLKLYQIGPPDALTPAALDRLLAVDDALLAGKLTALDVASLEGLLTVSSAGLVELTTQLSPRDLDAIGLVLNGLDVQRKNELVSALLRDPTAVDAVVRGGAALLTSRDLPAAVTFLNGPADVVGYGADLLALGRGAVSVRLFAAKYGLLITAATVVLPLLLLLGVVFSLLRLIIGPFVGLVRLFGRRR